MTISIEQFLAAGSYRQIPTRDGRGCPIPSKVGTQVVPRRKTEARAINKALETFEPPLYKPLAPSPGSVSSVQ